MADCTDVQALEKISSEVDEAQIRITLSSHCIKAQAYLVEKLRKQSERQREICVFMSNGNLKLEAEIKQAEHEIKSLTIAYETIRSSNVELKKELLLAKENKKEIEERVKTGEKKYEDLWLESKARYESIPRVQTLLQTRNKAQTLKENITVLYDEAQKFVFDIDNKKKEYLNLDRKIIIQLANFIVIEAPKTFNLIKEKIIEISVLEKEIELFKEEIRESKVCLSESTVQAAQVAEKQAIVDDTWPNLYTNSNGSPLIPKLHLANKDFDVLSATLDQIKIKRGEILHTAPLTRINSTTCQEEPTTSTITKDEENIPYLFNIYDKDTHKRGYFANRKLINILEDIKLDKNDTYDIVSNLNPNKFKDVSKIGADNDKNEKEPTPMETEQIEEIDLTGTNSQNIVVPPTQFLDYSQEKIISGSQQPTNIIVHENENTDKVNTPLKNSQENIKKKVSFDMSQNTPIEDVVDNTEVVMETTVSELNVSAVSDDGYARIKDMILKKHQLDLSPQFIYAKNTALNIKNDNIAVTSKFFEQKTNVDNEIIESDKEVLQNNKEEIVEEQISVMEEGNDVENFCEEQNVAISSPPKEIPKLGKPITGFLFSHGTQGIPDSLDVSISTTGFEEGEVDFPHCIDSSLLLSPKADLPMAGSNTIVLSQEVPNFLTGLRKTGLSLFGIASSETNAEQNNKQDSSNSFNFNFGTEEKKNRGGLFSMFH